MKKLFVRMVSICCILAMTLCLAPTAFASASKTKGCTGSSNFNDEWEKTTTYYVGETKVGYMIWGFDKDWIHEDYVWTVGYECSTQAAVKRNYYDTDYISGGWAQAYFYSQEEVTHQTYSVSYKITFSATYTGLTEGSTEASNVK